MGVKPTPSLAATVKPPEGGDGEGGDPSEEEEVFEFFISGVHEGSQVISHPAEESGEIEKGVEYSRNGVVVHED